jgi:hypothetical protein
MVIIASSLHEANAAHLIGPFCVDIRDTNGALVAIAKAQFRPQSPHACRHKLSHSELEAAQFDDIAFRQLAPGSWHISHHKPQLL